MPTRVRHTLSSLFDALLVTGVVSAATASCSSKAAPASTAPNCTLVSDCGASHAGEGGDTTPEAGREATDANADRSADASREGAPTANLLVVLSGDKQTGMPAQATASAVELELVDAAGQPVPNATLTVSAPAGVAVSPTVTKTDSVGVATVFLRRGLRPGTATVTFTGPSSSSVDVELVTEAPKAGTVFTIVNAERRPSAPATAGPATSSSTGLPMGIAADASGGFYYGDDGNCGVVHVDGDGVLSKVTGQLDGCSDTGNSGPASLATVGQVQSMFVEPNRRTLTLSSVGGELRQIDLSSGSIKTIAGGGSTTLSIGLSATDADLGQPYVSFVEPSGDVAFQFGSSQLGLALVSAGVVAPFPTAVGDCTSNLSIAPPISRWVGLTAAGDGAGNYYFAGDICGVAPNSTTFTTPGIVAIDSVGGLAHVAGNAAGTYDDGVAATHALFSTLAGVAYHAGKVYVADSLLEVIRMIDLSTGIITTIAGVGTGTVGNDFAEYVDALQTAAIVNQNALAVTTDGHIVYGDSSTNASLVRMIW